MNMSAAHLAWVKLALASVGGSVVYLLGSHNLAGLGAVATLCLIDFVAALVVAKKKKKAIISRRFTKKLGDFCMYSGVLMTMNLLTIVNAKFNLFIDSAIVWCALREALSILEHAGELGYNLPVPLLKDLKKEQDEIHKG